MPNPIASGRILRRFADRVAGDLARNPLSLDPEAHRRRIGELLATCGQLTHYELLGVPTEAREDEIQEAFEQLAKLVHPQHAERLDLVGREGLLELLFERATEAYLVISDPERRSAYDREAAVEHTRPAVERAAEAKELARELYVRARWMVEEEDYHFAVELLRQAVRHDPRADYFYLLGKAQARNAHWLHMAVDSLRQAVDRDRTNPDYRLALGEVYERSGQLDNALAVYEELLQRTPDHPGARNALSRVTLARRGR